MSTHHRALLRSEVKAAIQGDAGFAEVTILDVFAQNIDDNALPAMTVSTPGETSELTSDDDLERSVALVVHFVFAGVGLIEDDLDDRAAKIEGLVMPVLGDAGVGQHYLERTELDLIGEGRRRMGSVRLSFRTTRFTHHGLPD